MDEVKLTVSQAAQQIGETVHIVRNWMKDFRDYIPSEKSANGYNLFTQEAIDVLVRIKKMHREQNLSTKQIEAILSGADKPTVKDDVAIEVSGEIREFLEEQRQFNKALLEEMAEQRRQFESFTQRRDEQINYVLRELMEQKQLAAATERKKSWWKFWGN